jgi:hypothetical protein
MLLAAWLYYWFVSGSNSVVECDLAKVEVAGSNPVSRSTRLKRRQAPIRPKPPSLFRLKAGADTAA